MDVPAGGRWQGQPYYNPDLQIQNDLRSPNPVYSPASSYTPQYQPSATPSYPTTHSPSRGAVPTTANAHYQQSMAMGHPSSDRSFQPSRNTPYARVATAPPPPPPMPMPMPNDMQPEEPTIKKKRKRADARQLGELNAMYSRTAFPSTEERVELARRLDMTARSVQIWLAHSLVYTACIISELSTILPGSRTKDRRAVKADEILPTLQLARSIQISLQTPRLLACILMGARPL